MNLKRRTLMAAVLSTALALPVLSTVAFAQTPGDTLVWAVNARPKSLDPNIWSGGTDLAMMRQVYDTLVWSPTPGTFEPGLASSWEMSEDGLVYTFKLRQDVTFHDGTKFNADAVKTMFDRIKNPESRSLNIGAIGPYESSEVIDDYTIAVTLSRPWGPFLTNVSEPHLSIASPTALAAQGDNFAQAPVGTGPYKFEKWEGNDLHLVRNPDYAWAPAFAGAAAPTLEKVVLKEVPEASTRTNALRTGEVDMIGFPAMSEVDSLEQAGFVVNRMVQPGFSWSFPVNVTAEPTSDLRVRKAMLAAISNEQIVRTVMFNQVKPAYGPLTAATLGYDPAVKDMYKYDLALAGQLLDEAGWALPAGKTIREKDGKPLSVTMAMFDSGVNRAVTELAGAMLSQAGFDVTLDIANYAAFATQITEGKYHTAQMRWSAVDPDQVIPTMFSSEQITGGGQFNRTRIADAELDKLVVAAGATADVAEREALYSQVQKLAMENVWLIPVFDDVWFFINKPTIDGFVTDLQGRPLLFAASKSDK